MYTEKANPRNKMIPMTNLSKNTDYNAWVLFFVVLFTLKCKSLEMFYRQVNTITLIQTLATVLNIQAQIHKVMKSILHRIKYTIVELNYLPYSSLVCSI